MSGRRIPFMLEQTVGHHAANWASGDFGWSLGSSRREPKLACVSWRPRHGFAVAQVGKTIYAVSGVNNAGGAGTLSVVPVNEIYEP